MKYLISASRYFSNTPSDKATIDYQAMFYKRMSEKYQISPTPLKRGRIFSKSPAILKALHLLASPLKRRNSGPLWGLGSRIESATT
jgi:hypothetical protein